MREILQETQLSAISKVTKQISKQINPSKLNHQPTVSSSQSNKRLPFRYFWKYQQNDHDLFEKTQELVISIEKKHKQRNERILDILHGKSENRMNLINRMKVEFPEDFSNSNCNEDNFTDDNILSEYLLNLLNKEPIDELLTNPFRDYSYFTFSSSLNCELSDQWIQGILDSLKKPQESQTKKTSKNNVEIIINAEQIYLIEFIEVFNSEFRVLIEGLSEEQRENFQNKESKEFQNKMYKNIVITWNPLSQEYDGEISFSSLSEYLEGSIQLIFQGHRVSKYGITQYSHIILEIFRDIKSKETQQQEEEKKLELESLEIHTKNQSIPLKTQVNSQKNPHLHQEEVQKESILIDESDNDEPFSLPNLNNTNNTIVKQFKPNTYQQSQPLQQLLQKSPYPQKNNQKQSFKDSNQNNHLHHSSSPSDSPYSTSVSSNSPSSYSHSPLRKQSSSSRSHSYVYPSRNEDMILILSRAINDTIDILPSNLKSPLFEFHMYIRSVSKSIQQMATEITQMATKIKSLNSKGTHLQIKEEINFLRDFQPHKMFYFLWDALKHYTPMPSSLRKLKNKL